MRNYTFTFLFDAYYGADELWMETLHGETIQDTWIALLKRERKKNLTWNESMQKFHEHTLERLTAVHIICNMQSDTKDKSLGTHTEDYPEKHNAFTLIRNIKIK